VCENVCGAAVRAGESACVVGRCVRVRPFVPFWGTTGVALKTAPVGVGSGPRRGNGFWFDKRPTGGGRPIHAKTRTVRFYVSSSAIFSFPLCLPRAISLFASRHPPPPTVATRANRFLPALLVPDVHNNIILLFIIYCIIFMYQCHCAALNIILCCA